jgi:hypothetical protein
MSKSRVYLPSTLTRLRDVVASGGSGPLPLLAHAVTQSLCTQYPDGTEEDWEYAALSAAALDAVGLLNDDDPPRRVVIVVEVDSSLVPEPVDQGDPTLVELRAVVPAGAIAAVHVDSEDAEDKIAAARAAWADAQAGDETAVAVVERCLEHELGWYATQEIGDLLER